MQPEEFDAWRDAYEGMSFADHQAFAERVTAEYPRQQHFDAVQALTYFAYQHQPRAQIAEFGGYDGALAAQVLAAFPGILAWTNYDFDRTAAPVCHDLRYGAVPLREFIWERPPLTGADTLVSTHTIEHLSEAHLERLLDWVTAGSVQRMYLESPLPMTGSPGQWKGYVGTHMLPMGWVEIHAALEARGWAAVGGSRECRWLVRERRAP